MAAMENLEVSFQLVPLISEIIDGANGKTSLQEQVEYIEKKLWSMVDLFDRINALHQLPQNANELMEQIRMVIRKSEDVTDTYAKEKLQSKMAAIHKKALYWNERRYLTRDIMKIKNEIINVLKQLQTLHTYNFMSSSGSSGSEIRGSPNMMPGSELYQDVPFHLRQCIYYFLLFPAEFDIPARRLIVLWVAEGLVRPNKDRNEPAEHVAERYLDELIKKNVVTVTRSKLNGKVKSCQLNDGRRRDALLNIAKEAKFFEHKAGHIPRLVDHNGTSQFRDPCFIHIKGNPIFSASMSKYGDTLSLLSFNNQEGSKPGEDIGDFLDRCISAGCFRWMRVLDLERVFRPKLPKALSKLRFLRYLGLRWTYIEHLPDFVNKLFNLQVLDVKHTYISMLPRSIWRMQYLRHLYLSESYRTRFHGQPSNISLNNLQTLWGAFIDEDTCVRNGLNTLLKIRKLGLSCRPSSSSENSPPTSSSGNSQPSSSPGSSLTPSSSGNSLPPSSSGTSPMSEQLQAVQEWISKLESLESLRLKSRDEHGKAADLHLTSLERKTKLSTVYLLGKLNPHVVCKFPESLTDITLSRSELDMDPMEFLERLPNLQILRLLAQSVLHNRMHCSRGGFHKLKLLHIWKLKNLDEWEAEEGSLPSLQELEFRSCENLKKRPEGLQHVRTLCKVRLTSMHPEFIDAVKANQSHWDEIQCALEVDEEKF